MKAKARAGVVILQDNCVALIHRFRDGGEYYVIPGGGIDSGETPKEAAGREAYEELGLKVHIERLLHLVANR